MVVDRLAVEASQESKATREAVVRTWPLRYTLKANECGEERSIIDAHLVPLSGQVRGYRGVIRGINCRVQDLGFFHPISAHLGTVSEASDTSDIVFLGMQRTVPRRTCNL